MVLIEAFALWAACAIDPQILAVSGVSPELLDLRGYPRPGDIKTLQLRERSPRLTVILQLPVYYFCLLLLEGCDFSGCQNERRAFHAD